MARGDLRGRPGDLRGRPCIYNYELTDIVDVMNSGGGINAGLAGHDGEGCKPD